MRLREELALTYHSFSPDIELFDEETLRRLLEKSKERAIERQERASLQNRIQGMGGARATRGSNEEEESSDASHSDISEES